MSPTLCSEALLSEGIALGDEDITIVVSQSCDVICESIAAEPFVDVQIGRPILVLDGNNTYGKNPRVIDFENGDSPDVRCYRCVDAERRRLDRKLLRGGLPVGALAPKTIRLLANWTGRRYTRPALPDEFNRRRKIVSQQVARIGREFAQEIASFYVVLNEDSELEPDESYVIFLIGTAMADVASDPAKFARATKAVALMAAALNGNGISVVEALAKSEDDVSLTDVREMIRLDLDYISIRGGIDEGQLEAEN